MKRSTLGLCLLLAFGTVLDASAQTGPATYVFTTVDSVENGAGVQLVVTGILQGDAAATTHTLYFYTADRSAAVQSCEKMALLVMAKPGQYTLTFTNYTNATLQKCALGRVGP